MNFAFRYSIIRGAGTGNIERAFTDAALLLHKRGKDATIIDIWEKVAHLYPGDTEFESDFAEKQITQSALARYILRSINDHLDDSGAVADSDAFTVNLEHVLPKNFNENEWEDFKDGDDIEIVEYVDRIGNMTLLTVALNSRSSNKSFADKKRKYEEKPPLKISQYVYDQNRWTYRNVEENQRRLATIANRVWSVDYANVSVSQSQDEPETPLLGLALD